MNSARKALYEKVAKMATPKDAQEAPPEQVRMSTLARWFINDVANDAETIELLNAVFGMVPVSAEGQAMEEEDALRRAAPLEPLDTYLSLYAKINAAAFANMQNSFLHNAAASLREQEVEVTPAMLMELLMQWTTGYSYFAFRSFLATSIALNIVAINPLIPKAGAVSDE